MTDLAKSITERVQRLAAVGGDALQVLDGLLTRLELGADRYGPLVLASDRRNWEQEADEELADYAVYRALARVSSRRSSKDFDVSDERDVVRRAP